MIITLSFVELSDYIRRHYGKSVGFSCVSAKEVKVSYEQPVILGRSVTVSETLCVEKVQDSSLTLVYKGGFGKDIIIAGALKFIRMTMPDVDAALTVGEDHQVTINLAKLPTTQMLVKAISLSSIRVLEDCFSVEASLR